MPGIRAEDVTILIATGTHRANTPAELERMLGADILGRYTVVNHDSRDDDSLAHVGETKTGVPVYLNKRWLAADVRITTGFVEPHFFAGFSGGPKMVAPGPGWPQDRHGAARRDAHRQPERDVGRHRGQSDPGRRPRDRADDRRHLLARRDAQPRPADHRASSPASCSPSTARPAPRPRAASCARWTSPFDVVLTTNSGYPLDQNLYQAVKGMSAAAKVVKPAGTIICAAECRDGLPNHGSYGEVLASRPSPQALLEMIHAPGYGVPDAWQVQIQAQIQVKARVLMKNSFMPPAAIRAAHFEPIDDVAASARQALAAAGAEATLCVLPQGPQTIPYLR